LPASRLRFVNLDGSEPQGLGAVLKWAVVDRVLGRRRPDPRPVHTPSVTPDLEALRQPPRPGEGVRITWIGHASWLVQLDGISLLVDPVFSESIGPGVRRQLPPAITSAGLPNIDAQLVTHNHRDHLDLPSLTSVRRPVIAGLGLTEFFNGHGLTCTELAWWESTRVGGVSVRFVPSQHWSRRGLNDANATLWGGFIIEGSSARIYHSGDTAYFGGFTHSEIARMLGMPLGTVKGRMRLGMEKMRTRMAEGFS
jgi:L-ascorbate metabolism protein UlaG (beta-lactamase superfamily)